jgi:hypothetical protein
LSPLKSGKLRGKKKRRKKGAINFKRANTKKQMGGWVDEAPNLISLTSGRTIIMH